MPQIWVQVEGIKEVIEEFRKMGEDGKKALHEAVNKAAETAKPQIQQAIPLNSEDNKHLKNNIYVSKAKPKKTLKQSAEIKIGKASVDYGFHLETGHRTKSGKHIPARPFIRTTVDSHSEEYANIIAEHVLDRIGV